MNEADPYEEGSPLRGAGFDDLLRALTLERFTLWRPPERSTGQAAHRRHPTGKTAVASVADAPNVRGRFHHDVNSKSRRVR